MALTILFLLLLVEGWDENANTQSEHKSDTNIHTDAFELHAFSGMGLMLVEAPGVLRANRINERVSATEWPLDHPFYCLTNSLCLCHLTAQRDPWGREDRQGGGRRRREQRLMGYCSESEQQMSD